MSFFEFLSKKIAPALALMMVAGCSSDTGEFFYGNLGAGGPKIVVANNVAGQYALAMYDIQGNFLATIADYNPSNTAPRGLQALNDFEFLVAYDGANIDGVVRFNALDRTPQNFVTDSNLSGNIFQLRRHETHGTFVIESNFIESFDDQGERINAPRIGTTIGACTLATPRGLAFNQQGQLIVVGTGNDNLLVYDVSNPANTVCVGANTSFAGTVNPVAVLAHSDGFLYVATQGDDRIYRFNGDGSGAPLVIFQNAGFMLDPTALLEMPDGSLLIASDGTNSLVNITTSGFLIGTNYLVSDLFTNSVSDMILLQENL